LTSLADAAAITKDPDAVTEAVRGAMGRAICKPYQNERGELSVIGVAPSLEERLMSSLVKTEQGAMLAVDPQQAQSIASRIARALEQAVAQPVLLCSPALRPHLHRMFSRVLPHLGVLSHAEVPPHIHVVPVATLD
jgi:flagellar biosynthesis protein FlhA